MRQQEILQRTIGPAPWYWDTFPGLTGVTGRKFVWKYHGDSGAMAFLVTLSPRQQPAQTVLALNTYCRPFLVPAGRLGIWCPEHGGKAETPYTRYLCFDPEALRPFPLEDIAGWFKGSNERLYAATAPLAEFDVSSGLGAGTHTVAVPDEFRLVEELLAISPYPAADNDQPNCAIHVLQPATACLTVLPQRWFTANQLDTGYQWITRVQRDPATGHIIGDGIRIRAFELDDSGTQVARWLS